jgi:serine/threonine protein kinase
MALLKLPNLAWIALSDNPFLEDMTALHESEEQSLPILDAPELESLDGPVLGAGASGTTRRLDYMGTPVAVKTYANDTMTSDGNPQQERLLALTASTVHADGLIQVLGVTLNKHCLVMELLEHYQALAGPPNMESCSRDVYADDCRLSTASARFLVSSMLQVLTELHNRGMSHGDFYGHNILVTNKGSFHAKLHDFGAAFYYDRSAGYAPYIERIELRAFGILVEEVQRRVCDEKDTMILQQFLELAKQSRSVPTFAALREWWTRMTERLIEHVEEHEFHQIGSEGA